jgi:multimeric flavodoxin WrbA
MNLKALGISASPRLQGNSDLLLLEALAGAESAGAQVEYIRLCDLNIAPCIECNSCYKTGRCRIEDDYQLLSAKILGVDRLIFASPVFFMTVCAQAKLLIDRCQCLWAHKNVLKEPLITSSGRDRRAMVIAVGGSRGKKMFGCIRLTMKSYFDVLDMHYSPGLFVSSVDALGEIKKHPSAMTDAFHLGHQLVITTAPPPEKPTDIELT